MQGASSDQLHHDPEPDAVDPASIRGRRLLDDRVLSRALPLLFLLFFAIWHAGGVFGGQVYYAEDTAAYFFSNRAVHHAIASEGSWSFWDPLPGLGAPRLANIQNGSFAPLSLLFYLFPTASVFAIYPALVSALLASLTFALFRARGVTSLPAAFGALGWATLGTLNSHLQHPPVVETLLFLPLTLFAWERIRQTGGARWIIVGGLGLAFQCFGSSPQYLVYNALLMSLWLGSDLLGTLRRDRSEFIAEAARVTGLVVIGLGLASWQLLPFLEMAGEAHRSWLHDASGFASQFRSTAPEMLRALAAESFLLFDAPVSTYGAPYRLLPNLSLLSVGFAVFAFWKGPRPWALAVGVVLFMLGTMGEDGGVTPLLSKVIPFADRLRAPSRMIVPAAFLVAWLSALGLQAWLDHGARWRQPVAIAAVLWLAGTGFALNRPRARYVDPAVFAVPAPVARAEGRVVTDFRHSDRGMPLFLVNAGLAAGVPTLLMREVIIPGNLFEAYFASQFGSLDQARAVDQMIVSAALPVVRPTLPIMRAFRLETLVRFGSGRIGSRKLPDTLERFTLVPRFRVETDPNQLWAAAGSEEWDPREIALLRAPNAALDAIAAEASDLRERRLATPSTIEIIADDKAEQRLVVDSGGGILVTSELFFPGWNVKVDGQDAEAIEVDLALRGVVVPAGRHEVHWRYTPTWLLGAWCGLALSILAAAASLVWARRDSSRPATGG